MRRVCRPLTVSGRLRACSLPGKVGSGPVLVGGDVVDLEVGHALDLDLFADGGEGPALSDTKRRAVVARHEERTTTAFRQLPMSATMPSRFPNSPYHETCAGATCSNDQAQSPAWHVRSLLPETDADTPWPRRVVGPVEKCRTGDAHTNTEPIQDHPY